MTRKKNLIALRDAVVEGAADADIFRDIWRHEKVFTMETAIGIKRTCFNGDMNAALAFVAELLPDAWVSVFKSGKYAHAVLELDGFEYEGSNQPTPARALLIAALNALIEETDE